MERPPMSNITEVASAKSAFLSEEFTFLFHILVQAQETL